jgi:hypothetical protein
MESDDFFVPTVVVRGRCVSVPRVVLRLSVRGTGAEAGGNEKGVTREV